MRKRPLSDKELSTTSGNLWLDNLDGQWKGLAEFTKKNPKDGIRMRQYASVLYLHGRMRGDLDELQKSVDVTSRVIALDPKSASPYVLRAHHQQTLHRFKEARKDLETASKLGADAETVRSIAMELDWNEGKYEPAIAEIRAERAKTPNFNTLVREGQLEHDLGNYDRADELFEQAESHVRDTSPWPLVQLYVTRGVHLYEAGRVEEAVLFFQNAVERLPAHIPAREHLAEALHELGRDDEAQPLYEAIVKETTDPEFVGALASVLRARGKTQEADVLLKKARKRYGELLQKYPEAMYWHASEFFLEDADDPKQAVDLLRKNVDLRPNAKSQTALARALLATGDVAGAQGLVDKALESPIQTGQLFWTAARVYAKLGDATKSEALARRARKMDVRIEAREPKLGE